MACHQCNGARFAIPLAHSLVRTSEGPHDSGSMEIHVVGPAWGLPTADPACLAVLTYCRFRKVPASHIHMDRLTLNQPGEP